MDLNCFFEALEELANRLFPYEDPYDNLSKLIKLIKKSIQINKNPTIYSNQQEMLLQPSRSINTTPAGSANTGVNNRSVTPNKVTGRDLI